MHKHECTCQECEEYDGDRFIVGALAVILIELCAGTIIVLGCMAMGWLP